MGRKYGSAVDVPKVASTPASPSAGYVSIYAKSDDKVYSLTSGGTETDLTATGGGGGGSGGPIATSVVTTSGSTTSSTLQDVGATGSDITFTAPASGQVAVRYTGSVSVAASTLYSWGIREAGATVAAARPVLNNSSSGTIVAGVSAVFLVTGLSAGSHTFNWAHARTGGSGSVSLLSGSGFIEVWAA